jgi:MYXO-CTERM domain-containing protein
VQRFNTDQVRMTKDLGATFAGIDGDLPNVPANTVDAAVVAGQNMIFVGTDQGVYFSCNEGMHWAKLGQNLPNIPVTDVRYDPAFKRVVVGTMGRGIWSIAEPTAAGCTGPGGADGGPVGPTGTGGASGTTSGTTGSTGTATTSGSGGATGGSGGDVGTSGSSTATGTGTGPTGAGGAVTTATTGGNVGAGGTGPGGAGDTGGCSCRMATGSSGTALAFAAAGIVAAFGRRRRRR